MGMTDDGYAEATEPCRPDAMMGCHITVVTKLGARLFRSVLTVFSETEGETVGLLVDAILGRGRDGERLTKRLRPNRRVSVDFRYSDVGYYKQNLSTYKEVSGRL